MVGACVAVAGEVAISVLLYAGPGFVRSLTTVLAVEAIAFGGGLWNAPVPGPDLVERLRRRWLVCLAAFLVAATFGTSWSLVQTLGGGRLGQGIGLAILAAFPLYTCGMVIGGLGAVSARGSEGWARGPGVPATMGAALGFVLTGVLLPRAPIPASLLVGCLVLLSAGGMTFGLVLGSRREREVEEGERPDRIAGSPLPAEAGVIEEEMEA